MARHLNLQKIALACSTFLALSTFHFNVQSADTGTLTVTGAVNNTTCTIQFDGNISGSGGTQTMALDTVKVSDLATGSSASPTAISTGAKSTVISVTNGSLGACTGVSQWDIGFLASSTAISTIGSNVFLKSSSGTNALVGIKTALVNTFRGAAPDFSTVTSFTSPQTTTTFKAAATNSIAIQAVWVGVGNASTTPGSFSQSIPLTFNYQ